MGAGFDAGPYTGEHPILVEYKAARDVATSQFIVPESGMLVAEMLRFIRTGLA